MKILKLIAFTMGLIFVCPGVVFATEENVATEKQLIVSNQYGYIELGGMGVLVPIVVPTLGCGYRFQKGSNGFDGNLQFSTLICVSEAKLGLHYMHYFNPDIKNENYLGIGPAIGGVWGAWGSRVAGLGFAPEIIFGKQYMTDAGAKRHFQGNLIWPIYSMGYHQHHNHLPLPVFSVSYSWGF